MVLVNAALAAYRKHDLDELGSITAGQCSARITIFFFGCYDEDTLT